MTEHYSMPIPILMEDDIVHTDERPTCDDPNCPCWIAFYEAQDQQEQTCIERGFMSYSQLPEFRSNQEKEDA